MWPAHVCPLLQSLGWKGRTVTLIWPVFFMISNHSGLTQSHLYDFMKSVCPCKIVKFPTFSASPEDILNLNGASYPSGGRATPPGDELPLQEASYPSRGRVTPPGDKLPLRRVSYPSGGRATPLGGRATPPGGKLPLREASYLSGGQATPSGGELSLLFSSVQFTVMFSL